MVKNQIESQYELNQLKNLIVGVVLLGLVLSKFWKLILFGFVGVLLKKV